MVRFGALAAAMFVALAIAADAQPVRYGTPSGCAGTPAVAPYLLYDGTKLISAAGWACDVTPVGGKMRGQCSGTPGSWVEDFTVVASSERVDITRADGTTRIGLPVCK